MSRHSTHHRTDAPTQHRDARPAPRCLDRYMPPDLLWRRPGEAPPKRPTRRRTGQG